MPCHFRIWVPSIACGTYPQSFIVFTQRSLRNLDLFDCARLVFYSSDPTRRARLRNLKAGHHWNFLVRFYRLYFLLERFSVGTRRCAATDLNGSSSASGKLYGNQPRLSVSFHRMVHANSSRTRFWHQSVLGTRLTSFSFFTPSTRVKNHCFDPCFLWNITNHSFLCLTACY